jgi:hypothetical protein
MCTWIVSLGCGAGRLNMAKEHDQGLTRLVESWGEDWVLMNEPLNVDYYGHLKSTNRLPNGCVRIWMRTLFWTGHESRGKKDSVDYYQTLQEFDCVNKKYRYLYSEGFDRYGTKIGSPWQDENSKWSYLKPDDDYRAIFTKLCK